MGDYDTALDHYRAALPVFLAKRGEFCEEVATLHHNLGGIMFVKGALDEAVRWARRGVELRRRVSGSDHINVVYDQAPLAPILIQMGE